MKQKAGQNNCGNPMTVENDIGEYICMMLKSDDYKTATIIAPGSKYQKAVDMIKEVVAVDNVYDLDPALPYTVADPIFDDIEIDSEIIITLHGEKLYPPCWKFDKSNHIMVVANGNPLDPTSDEKFEHAQFAEVTSVGKRSIYYMVQDGFY